LARITDKAIDVVIVDKYALHILEKNDYLMPLDSSLNKTVASHKKIAIRLNSDKPLYACIIKNSIHKDEAIKYIHYLVKEEF
jgi:ABC-type Fe3+ transport system substrate-binding protein